MNITTLNEANRLNQKIEKLSETLSCLEREHNGKTYTTNPILFLEFDEEFDDGRARLPLPMNLSDMLISFLKAEIVKQIDAAVTQFNML